MAVEGVGENRMLRLKFTPRHKRSKRFLSVSHAYASLKKLIFNLCIKLFLVYGRNLFLFFLL